MSGPLDHVLGSGGTPACSVGNGWSCHWWATDATEGDPCLCGEVRKRPDESRIASVSRLDLCASCGTMKNLPEGSDECARCVAANGRAMSLYTSKPQHVEAVQWTGENWDEVRSALPEKVLLDFGVDYLPDTEPNPDGDVVDQLMLLAGKDGAQDWVPVPVGHWLVHQPDDLSDVWPVEDTYFQAKYLPANGRSVE